MPEWTLLLALITVCLAWIGILLAICYAIKKRVASLARLEAKVDLLLKTAGVKYDPFEDISPQVVDALERHDKILAIKRYRDATGAGLKDAKDFIEEVQRRAGLA